MRAQALVTPGPVTAADLACPACDAGNWEVVVASREMRRGILVVESADPLRVRRDFGAPLGAETVGATCAVCGWEAAAGSRGLIAVAYAWGNP